jgi:competence protein ComEA
VKKPNSTFSFLNFTKKERRGIFGLIFIICVVALLPSIYAKYKSATMVYPIADSSFSALLLSDTENIAHFFKHDYESNYNNNIYKKDFENLQATLFTFDPNTIDESTWHKLGTKHKTAAGIIKYVSKGGKFRQPEDIQKIWGMTDELKNRLQPFIKITPAEFKQYTNENAPFEKKIYEKKVIIVDVNTADSAAFESLPGIGGGYAKRIITFRNKLGGFYKIEQVAETFGLPDSTYQKIKPNLVLKTGIYAKLNLNTATIEELKAHPYIRWQLANVIMNYKKQHGDFKTIDDLKKIMLIDEQTFNKISPYLIL